jgi:hypothetical protein
MIVHVQFGLNQISKMDNLRAQATLGTQDTEQTVLNKR